MHRELKSLGWDTSYRIESEITEECSIARINAVHKDIFSILTERGEIPALLTGKLYHDNDLFPVVGDWVIISEIDNGEKAVIRDLIPRKNYLSRKAAGKETREQLIAANLDYAFIVQGLDDNYNLRRLERYIAMVRQSDITPVILLNKSDLRDDINSVISEVSTIAGSIDMHALSCKTGSGIDSLKAYFKTGVTACFLGSSGVGKSSIINRLMKVDLQRVRDVRGSDSRGRHTTTTRQLILLPEGGLVIDTPGMRELQLWEDSAQLQSSFHDIDELAERCQYKDCTHENEPGCNVRRAVEEGLLARDRLNSFLKLKREAEYLQSLQSEMKYRERKKSEKRLARDIRELYKTRKKR
jgi:ribosome biogenesis GTPase